MSENTHAWNIRVWNNFHHGVNVFTKIQDNSHLLFFVIFFTSCVFKEFSHFINIF